MALVTRTPTSTRTGWSVDSSGQVSTVVTAAAPNLPRWVPDGQCKAAVQVLSEVREAHQPLAGRLHQLREARMSREGEVCPACFRGIIKKRRCTSCGAVKTY
jgi:hypothetical protein